MRPRTSVACCPVTVMADERPVKQKCGLGDRLLRHIRRAVNTGLVESEEKLNHE